MASRRPKPHRILVRTDARVRDSSPHGSEWEGAEKDGHNAYLAEPGLPSGSAMEKLVITVAPTGDVNSVETVQFLAKTMLDLHIKPEIEAFDVGFIQQGRKLVDTGIVKEPAHFQLVMGVDGGVPATPDNLLHMRNQLPPTATYVVAGMSRMQLPMTTMAVLLGGHVRVGLEDNLYLKKGVLARNEELVARAHHLADDLQREVATPDEARRIMGLPART